MKKKILYLSYDGILEPLGYSQVVCYIKKLSYDYEITLISFEKKNDIKTKNINELKKELKELNIDWYFLHYHSFPKILSTIYDILKGFFLIFYIIYIKKIKILHCRSYISGTLSLMISFFFKMQIIFDMRGFWINERSDRQGLSKKSLIFIFFKKVEKYLYHKSNIIITLTHQAKEIILNNNPNISKDKIYVIPTCADEDYFIPYSNNNPKKEIILGYIGSIDTAYDIKKIILSFSKLVKNIPNIHLKIFTKDIIKFNTLIKNYNISKSYYSVGFVDRNNILKEIQSFDYGIFYINKNFSSTASFPTKIAEFFLCGIPIICNHFNEDISNLINDNHLGIINEFQDNDHNQLINYILNNHSNYQNAILCRKFALQNLSLSNGYNIYKKIYEKLS